MMSERCLSPCSILQILLLALVAQAGLAHPVNIPDPALKQVIKDQLGITHDPNEADMLALGVLEKPWRNIASLTGLEYATNLWGLDLHGNQISDISALSGLTNLTVLDLVGNPISDISALSGLTNLWALQLSGTFSDISALSGLTNLERLSLGTGTISDISALSGLTKLTDLYLYNNQISDISALSGLTNLMWLGLTGNPLNQEACDVYFPMILANNPGIWGIEPWPCCYWPMITEHPQSQTVCQGGSVTFTVSATGTAPLSYQWRKAGTNIGWATTSASYTINPVAPGDAGSYDCVVANPYGVAISNAATLTVNTPPVIATHPQSQTVCQGGSVTFTVSATGTAPLSYQWRKAGTNIGGATSSSYTINPVASGDVGSYDCVVTNACGSATSNAATLTVNTPPVIATHPQSQTVCQGGSVTFTVSATGTAPLSYQWRKAGTNIGGATSASYTINPVAPGDAGSYDCVVTNAYGSATSDAATLTVNSPAVITSTPVTTATANQGYAYDVEATGIPAPTYSLVSSPTGMTINAVSGLIQWTPTSDQAGSNPVTVRAANSCGSADQSFNVDVTPIHSLVISSTPGGSVISPGEGTFQYNHADQVMLQAKADPLFVFVGWRGSIFVNVNPCPLTMNADYTVRAHFESVLDVLYVDDNAPGDPNLSDPSENGIQEHPFDTVQEAIDVAKKGAKVIVRPGTYMETIDLLGKGIEINGLNSDYPTITALPVIDGQGKDTVIRCTQREDPNCLLTGLVLTGGRGRLAGGILCVGSSPSILNCLIVGNRATAIGAGGGVYCRDSNAVFVNCTISGNCGITSGAGVRLSDSNVVLLDSIVWENLPPQIEVSGTGHCAITYTAVAGGWPGTGNLDADPCFVLPGDWADPVDLTKVLSATDPAAVWVAGDYHLMSQAGRWDPISKIWIKDSVTSPCIDASDPNTPIGQEPLPNGGRVNLGVYGGTNQASLSSSGG